MEGSDKLLIGSQLKDKTSLKILIVTDLHCDNKGNEALVALVDQ
jgi:hypothetical protein